MPQDLRRAFSVPERSHSTSTMAEKSLPPNPRARAVLNASRAAAPIGIGDLAALAASTINVRSLCARSMVNPGAISPDAAGRYRDP